MIYGYARVSTKGQEKDGNSLEAQEKQILEKYSNAVIKKEAYTGTTTDRPIFTEIIDSMEKGDMLVVAKLDRLARNTTEGLEIVRGLFEKGCSVHVLNVGLLEDTPMGQFFLTTLLAVAELERTMIVERTQQGKAMAKENNPQFKEGRPKALKKAQRENALELLKTKTYKEVEEITGVSRRTLMRYKKEAQAKEIIAEMEQ